jgi:hypothetical protein
VCSIYADKVELAKSLFSFYNGIGSWRLSKPQYVAHLNVKLTKYHHSNIKMASNQITKLNIKDEYDR